MYRKGKGSYFLQTSNNFLQNFSYICDMETKTQNASIIEEAGKYCLDLSKLIFGGVVLVSIVDMSINIVTLLIVGIAIILILAYAGFALLKLSNTKKE